jgi:hypothetical protein
LEREGQQEGKTKAEMRAKKASEDDRPQNETRGGFFCYDPKRTFSDLGLNATLVFIFIETNITLPAVAVLL